MKFFIINPALLPILLCQFSVWNLTKIGRSDFFPHDAAIELIVPDRSGL